ncbi:alpha/beta-hydrolase [Colletotrichum caudatum]|nr:alpha/beta-hydrolase [Colletotrichum caudatum]
MGVQPSRSSEFEYQTATLNGVTYNYIHAEPAGEAVGTIFLIHGWPDLSLGWRKQIPYLLSKGLRVIVPDMMGYGGTDAPEDVNLYTTKRASDDIAALASHLGVSRIVLGGHDWGGAVVYRAALWHPELVAAFFVVSTPFAPPRVAYVDQALAIPTLRYQLQFRTDEVQDYIGPAGAQNATRVRQILNTIYGSRTPAGASAFNSSGAGLDFGLLDQVAADTPLMTADELDFYVANYAGADPFNRTLDWYRTGELNYRDELALLPSGGADAGAVFSAKFAQPALYIGGSQDSALPPVLSTGMEAYFDSLARGVANGSHWVMAERPAEVNGFIGGWLADSVLGMSAGLNLTTGIAAAAGALMR